MTKKLYIFLHLMILLLSIIVAICIHQHIDIILESKHNILSNLLTVLSIFFTFQLLSIQITIQYEKQKDFHQLLINNYYKKDIEFYEALTKFWKTENPEIAEEEKEKARTILDEANAIMEQLRPYEKIATLRNIWITTMIFLSTNIFLLFIFSSIKISNVVFNICQDATLIYCVGILILECLVNIKQFKEIKL